MLHGGGHRSSHTPLSAMTSDSVEISLEGGSPLLRPCLRFPPGTLIAYLRSRPVLWQYAPSHTLRALVPVRLTYLCLIILV